MSGDFCDLCGNRSSRFTCQMCITTGNFWVDKAKFSFSGKKQMVTNLRAEKYDLQKQVAKIYPLSFEVKDSILKSTQNEIASIHERISHNTSQMSILYAQISDIKQRICKRYALVEKKRKSIENYKKSLEDECSQISKSQNILKTEKSILQKQCHIVLRSLNERVFIISESKHEVKSILNIPFSECKNASGYVKQIKINRHDDVAHNTSIVLSLLVQLCNVLSVLLNSPLLYEINQSNFVGHGQTSRLLFISVKQLGSNILYLCLSQQVHPEFLEPYAFIGNIEHLFESKETCDYRAFYHSLDRPGESDEEDTPPSSSDSDAEWETVAGSVQDVPETAQIHQSSSYIGSLIWKS